MKTSKQYWAENPINIKIGSGGESVHRGNNQEQRPIFRNSEAAVKAGLDKLGVKPTVYAKRVIERDFSGSHGSFDSYRGNVREMLEVTSNGKFKGRRGSITRLEDMGLNVIVQDGRIEDDNSSPQQRTATGNKVVIQQVDSGDGSAKLKLVRGHFRPVYKVVAGNALAARQRVGEMSLLDAKAQFGDALEVKPGLS